MNFSSSTVVLSPIPSVVGPFVETLHLREGFELPDHSRSSTPLPFICALRPICEITFGLLLNSYIASLDAYNKRSVAQATKEGKPRQCTREWEKALTAAHSASIKFQDAETRRQEQLLTEANKLAQDAMDLLICSIQTVPDIVKTNLIMTGWNEEEVERL